MIVRDFLFLPLPLAALLLLGGSLWWARRRWIIDPELLRKGMHIGTGFICLSLPWLFATEWPVLAIALASGAGLVILRRLPADQEGVAGILHGVARRTAGELYFPLSVVLLFLLSHDEPLFYVIPLLVLTLADAVAALVGLRYGLSKYHAEDGQKSAEGSVAFFFVAFVASHVVLLLFTDMGRMETLLLACVIGLLVSMLEATAWSGLDNLFIPLGTWALLTVYIDASALALLEVLLVTLGLLVVALLWRRRTTLNDSCLFASVLVGYFAWAVGGWLWLVPIMLVFLTYTGLTWKDMERQGRDRISHDVRAVGATVLPALACLIGQLAVPEMNFYVSYVATLAAQLAIISLARVHCYRSDLSYRRIWWFASLQGWGVVVVPAAIFGAGWPALWVYLMLAWPLVSATAWLFQRLQPGLDDCPRDADRWWRQLWLGSMPALIAGVLMWLGGPWVG